MLGFLTGKVENNQGSKPWHSNRKSGSGTQKGKTGHLYDVGKMDPLVPVVSKSEIVQGIEQHKLCQRKLE